MKIMTEGNPCGTTVGIDLAKSIFSMHGIDEHGKAVMKRTVSRGKVMEVMAGIGPCLVGVEACSGAHHWARELGKLRHTVKIMAPRFVAPYRKSGKNDGNDAEAICEAVGRPSMRCVAVKSAEQQAWLVLHRVRKGLTDERTALINQLRGLLSEFGVVIPKGRYQARHQLPVVLDDPDNGIPVLARQVLLEVNERIRELDVRILAYDRRIEALARESERNRCSLVKQDTHLCSQQSRPCRVFQDVTYLRQGNAGKPLNELMDRGVFFKVFKERSNRNPRASENPSTTYAIRVALDITENG